MLPEDVRRGRYSYAQSGINKKYDALEAALAGDYQKAARLCAALMEQGNALAACDLAKIYREGLLGERDYEMAIALYE